MSVSYERKWVNILYGLPPVGLVAGIILSLGSGKEDIPTYFTSDRDGNSEIYSMDSEGKNTKRLTYNTKPDVNSSASPNGSELVSTRHQSDGSYHIILLDKNGRDKKTLVKGSGINHIYTQAWSPDGRRIVYTSNEEGGIFRIYVMNSDGGNQIVLTDGSDGGDVAPVWSPDGTRIAFIRMPKDTPKNNLGSKGKLLVIDLKKSNIHEITNEYGYATPAWNGNREILINEFSELQRGTAGCLSAIDINTGYIERITLPHDEKGSPADTHGCFHDHSPIPRGNKIIFVRWMAGGPYQIFEINRGGTGLKQLTYQGENYFPSIAIPKDGMVGQNSRGLEHLFTEKDGLLVPNYPGFIHGYFADLYRFMPISVPSGVAQKKHRDFVRQRLLEVP